MNRYDAIALRDFARALLERAGLASRLSTDVADVLVEGDLMGHDTHGLQLLAQYLGELEGGRMQRDGGFEVITQRGASALWNGKRLPGPWLTLRAVETASAMAARYGTGTVVIRHSHHIACLAAYLTRATSQGLAIHIACSDPNSASVAPHGGTRAVFTPDPFAIGFPTEGEPVLIDVSASLTTNGLTGRLHRQKKKLAHPWVIDAAGNATDDPAVLFTQPPGTILPLGGLDAGHKGFGLALMVEMLTGGLAGFGRADPKEGWGATVFVQVMDPAAFGGSAEFTRQMQWIVDACHANPPRAGFEAVRMPGERGLKRRAEQVRDGVELQEGILPALAPWAEKFGVTMPPAK